MYAEVLIQRIKSKNTAQRLIKSNGFISLTYLKILSEGYIQSGNAGNGCRGRQ